MCAQDQEVERKWTDNQEVQREYGVCYWGMCLFYLMLVAVCVCVHVSICMCMLVRVCVSIRVLVCLYARAQARACVRVFVPEEHLVVFVIFDAVLHRNVNRVPATLT